MAYNRWNPRSHQKPRPASGFGHPSLKAALIMLLPMLLVLGLRLYQPGWSPFIFFIPQGLFYLIAGLLAGRFVNFKRGALKTIHDPTLQYGAGAGICLWILYWLSFMIVSLVAGPYIREEAALAGAGVILFGFFDFLIAMALGALGSKIR